jgi:hypothetical protein
VVTSSDSNVETSNTQDNGCPGLSSGHQHPLFGGVWSEDEIRSVEGPLCAQERFGTGSILGH